MSKSRFKRAHKTHAFDQRAGERYPSLSAEQARSVDHAAGAAVVSLFDELCARVPDAAMRAALIGVPVTLDEAWLHGEGLPALRARRKRIEHALQGLRSAEAADSTT